MPDTAPTGLQALSASLAGLVAAAAPAVVAVASHRSRSSGFAWREDLVVTADEVLADEGEVTVMLPGGEQRRATIAGRDPSTDVALLRVEGGGLAPALLHDAPQLTGALAVAVGASEGGITAALGIVGAAGPTWQSMRGGRIDARIELDLRLPRGAEGCLALDAAGQAFGMAVLGPRRRVLVIPAATVERVAAMLQRHGRVPRGYLGLRLQSVRAEGDGAAGAMVMGVDPAGPGAAAGLRQGDVITGWAGQSVAGAQALLRAIGPDSVSQAFSVVAMRAGQRVELTLTVGERPAS
jgi:S1-C subfamily serine protease